MNHEVVLMLGNEHIEKNKIANFSSLQKKYLKKLCYQILSQLEVSNTPSDENEDDIHIYDFDCIA